MTSSDWATVASLATALGTLVLAFATFAAVRSGNRTARAAERSLLAGLRPVLMASHREDPTLKVNFGDSKWVGVPGGCAVGEVGGGDGSMGPKDGVVYLALSLRNVGQGISVLRAWYFHYERPPDDSHPPVAEFREHQRDLYLPVGQPGFWQGAFRDPAAPQYEPARRVVEQCEDWYLDLLYGDQEGGQRVITRFRMQMFSRGDRASRPTGDERGPWMATVARHWNLDRPDPRLSRESPRSRGCILCNFAVRAIIVSWQKIHRRGAGSASARSRPPGVRCTTRPCGSHSNAAWIT